MNVKEYAVNGRLRAALLLPLLIGACATATRGPMETFVVRTTPDGAQASSTSGWECVTPCSIQVRRRGDFVVTLRKDGYVTQTLTVRSVPAAPDPGIGHRVGVNTGWIGSITDMASGANYEHRPNPIEAVLERDR